MSQLHLSPLRPRSCRRIGKLWLYGQGSDATVKTAAEISSDRHSSQRVPAPVNYPIVKADWPTGNRFRQEAFRDAASAMSPLVQRIHLKRLPRGGNTQRSSLAFRN